MNNNEIEETKMTKIISAAQIDEVIASFSVTTKKSYSNDREEQESWFDSYAYKKDLDIPKEFGCDFCDKSFTQAGNLKRHKKIVHEGRAGYICDLCCKTFREVQSLKVHKRCVHDGIRDYSCAFCDKLCSTKSSLKTHVINNHAIIPVRKRNTKIACPICAIIFCGNLKRHIRTVHEGKSDYTCDLCFKNFKSVQSMKIHKHCVHEGRRDFICSECGRELSTRSGLRLHIRKNHSDADFDQIITDSLGKLPLSDDDQIMDIKTEFMETDDSIISNRFDDDTPLAICANISTNYNVKSEIVEDIEPLSKPEALTENPLRKSFPCKLCPKYYTQLGNLKRHIKTVHVTPDVKQETEVTKPEVPVQKTDNPKKIQITKLKIGNLQNEKLVKTARFGGQNGSNKIYLIPVKIMPISPSCSSLPTIPIKIGKPLPARKMSVPFSENDDFFVGN